MALAGTLDICAFSTLMNFYSANKVAKQVEDNFSNLDLGTFFQEML